MPEDPLPCDRWCPFLACAGCPYQGGSVCPTDANTPVDEVVCMSAGTETIGNGAAKAATNAAPNPHSETRKRLS